MVTGCFIVLMTASGLGFYGLAVYLNAFSNEKGWALATISLATTLFFVVGGVIGVVVARIIAVYDVRYVILAGGVIGGVSLALLGRVEEQWQLFVDYAFFGVGFAAAGLVPATTVVTRWFHVRRSVALSVASTGLSVGRHRHHAVRQAAARHAGPRGRDAVARPGVRGRDRAVRVVDDPPRSRGRRMGARR